MEPTFMELPETHYAKIDVLFGENAIEAYQKGAREIQYLTNLGGKIITKVFQTKDVFLGYLSGLEDGNYNQQTCFVIRTEINN